MGEQGPRPTRFQYPYATSPDIIRSNQKDAYFQALLLEHLSTILRNLKGARFLHNYSTEAKTLADILYFGLTTFVGNRTLGEEYCDIVQVEDGTARLPSVQLRAAYIASAILVPYLLNRVLPRVRRLLRSILERNLNAANRNVETKSRQFNAPTFPVRLQQYIFDNLDTLTSPAPVYAVSLATFYFTGAYYHLSKRLLGLRYIFSRNLPPSSQRAGYEVLGVLLLLQLSVQSYLHLRHTVSTSRHNDLDASAPAAGPLSVTSALSENLGGTEVSLDPNVYSTNNSLLFPSTHNTPTSQLHTTSSSDPDQVQQRIAAESNTPLATQPRIDLGQPEPQQYQASASPSSSPSPSKGKPTDNRQAASLAMNWLKGRQARNCTLCLEPMKDPSATLCGHIFCWTCICDWLRGEKAECPLCRQACAVQHVLPLR